MYFTTEESAEIVKDAGEYGYRLMTFYVGLAGQANPNMEDSQLSKMTDVSERTVKNTRLKLTKAGWFLRTKVTVKGEKHFMYAVGKQAVKQGLSGSIAILSKE